MHRPVSQDYIQLTARKDGSVQSKGLVVVLLLRDLCEHLEALLDKVLLDDSQDLVLLKGLPGDVQRQIL